jgi:fibronectin type 3 domain-containing protein
MDLQRSTTRHYYSLPIFLCLLVMAACSSPSSTPRNETAMLSWHASAGPGLAGYKIYQAHASGAYGAPIATVTMDVTSYTVTGLEAGSTYFFTVTAYNADGVESTFSNEVSKSIP